MPKLRQHNEYFRTVSLGGRKSCPNCHAKVDSNESLWSWGEYLRGQWHTVTHFCKECFPNIEMRLLEHSVQCRCEFNLVGYGGSKLPGWLRLTL